MVGMATARHVDPEDRHAFFLGGVLFAFCLVWCSLLFSWINVFVMYLWEGVLD